MHCSSWIEAASADLGGVSTGAGEWVASVGEQGVAGGAGGGLVGDVGNGLVGADGEPGAEVDELGEDELLAPPAPSKWT